MKYLILTVVAICLFIVFGAEVKLKQLMQIDSISIGEQVKSAYVTEFAGFLESDKFNALVKLERVNQAKKLLGDEVDIYMAGFIRGILSNRKEFDERGLGVVEDIPPFRDKISIVEHRGWREGLRAGAKIGFEIRENLIIHIMDKTKSESGRKGD